MIGVEICNNDKVLFRGGVLDFGDDYWLYNEDGTLDNFGFTYVTGDGIERDENGNVIDKIEPSASTIYELINDPELTHKGEALAWFGAAFICVLNVLSILFADELFRWNLLFQIRNVENAEPSDWEIAGRYIGWTVMTIMSLVILLQDYNNYSDLIIRIFKRTPCNVVFYVVIICPCLGSSFSASAESSVCSLPEAV